MVNRQCGQPSADVFLYLGGRGVKKLGVREIVANDLEEGGVVVTVADAFVTYDLQGYVSPLLDGAVKLKLVSLFDLAEGEKERYVSEIVNMVIDRRNAE